MPAFTFTADPATDQLHIVAHGLNTGDGPAATRNAGGALPDNLAWVTDYWIIRVDADHVKLADSSAHALAGTAIDIGPGAGAGTNTLEIGIPFERARTYLAAAINVGAAQVKSDDLNAMMDAFKALHRLLTGQPQTVWAGVTFAVPLKYPHANVVRPFGIDADDVIDVSGGVVTHVAGTGGCTVSAGATAYFKLPTLLSAERLNDLTIWAVDAGAIGTLKLFKYDETTTLYAIASALHTHPTGPTSVTPSAPAVTVGSVYVLRVEGGDGGVLLKKGEYLYDNPGG